MAGSSSSRTGRAWIAAVAASAAHNWVVHRHLSTRGYVATNLLFAAALVGLARCGGATWRDMGLRPDRLAAGVGYGLLASGLAAAGIAIAAAHPRTGPLFADDRIASLPPAQARFEATVRIPLGTGLAEEVMFRGALLGLSLTVRPWWPSVWRTSALFGLWHVVPALSGQPGPAAGARRMPYAAGRSVATSVLATTLAGAAFAALRGLSGSVVAPVVTHSTINAATFSAVRLRRACRADARW